jgi:hypothetical protein
MVRSGEPVLDRSSQRAVVPKMELSAGVQHVDPALRRVGRKVVERAGRRELEYLLP